MSRYSAVDNDRSAGHCCFHAVNIVAIVLWSLLLCCCVAGAVAGTLLWLTADQRRRYDTRKLWTLYIALPGKPRFFSCELKCHNCWHDPLDSTDSMECKSLRSKLTFCSGCKGILILRLQNQTHSLLNVILSMSIMLIKHACLQDDRDAHVYHSTFFSMGSKDVPTLKSTVAMYIGNRSSTKKNRKPNQTPSPKKKQNGTPTNPPNPPNHQTIRNLKLLSIGSPKNQTRQSRWLSKSIGFGGLRMSLQNAFMREFTVSGAQSLCCLL